MERETTAATNEMTDGLASTMLLRVPTGAFYVVVLRNDDTGEYLRYVEQHDLAAARATAAEWAAKGCPVAIWRRVE